MKNMFNRLTIVLFITVVSIISSLVITFMIAETFGTGMDAINVACAIIAPALIGPMVTWYIVGLLLKINQLEQEQRSLATYDALTGLLTRRAFLEQAGRALNLTHSGQMVALAYLDIDNFKHLNEQYGHAGGDAILKAFGVLIQHLIRRSDIAGRLGGEEFAIILPTASKDTAYQILERIRRAITEQVTVFKGQPIQYTVSIGLSLHPKASTTHLETLITHADHALFDAKRKGKNRIVLYSPSQ